MAETVSYTTKGKGWKCFHSFIPDWMIGLNSSLYTWENGDLYHHNSNSRRNSYYGVDYPSTVTPVFNQNHMDNKVFKTIGLDSNVAWKAEINTDFTSGIIEAEYLVEKEGVWYGHIRRNDGVVDLKAMSTQGLGVAAYSTLVFTFPFDIAASISVGDNIYVSSDPSTIDLQLVGPILSYTTNTITVSSALTIPNPTGDFVVSVKDSTAESYGARGSWMEVKLTNNDITEAELFTISSDALKSYP